MYCCKMICSTPHPSVKKITELLYLAILAAYFLKLFFGETLFYLQWPDNYEYILRIFTYVVVLLRLMYAGASVGTSLLAGILICLSVSKFSWLSTGYGSLWDTALLIAGAVNIPYRKILKVGFWIGLFVLLLAILGAFTGCIPDLAYQTIDKQFRYSFGIVYPTDFAAHVAFLFLTGWVLYEECRTLPFVGCALGLAAVIHKFNQAKCSVAILILCALSIVYLHLVQKRSAKYKLLHHFSNGINALLVRIMPLCAILMIGLSCFYKDNLPWMEYVNTLLSNRLQLGRQAIENYGITWFGTAFDQVGYGGSTVWSKAFTYNFVDSSYVMILVRYGAGILLAVCAQFTWLEKKALQNGCQRLAFAAALAAAHSMIEHHLLEVCFNLFLLLPFADFTQGEGAECRLVKKSRIAVFVIFLGTGCAVALTLPAVVTCLKTIVNLLHWDNPENHFAFIRILALGILAFYLILRMSIEVTLFMTGEQAGRKAPACGKRLLAIGLACALLLAEFAYFEIIIHEKANEYELLLSLDAPVIEALTKSPSTEDKLYIDILPKLYMHEFDGIRHMVMAGEGLAFEKDTTLITADKSELYALTETGFAYGSLPSGNAVYTTSAYAKSVLEREGITLTNYYSKIRNVDLKEAALQNNLTLTENGTLLLDGYDKSLKHGSNVTIYYGMFHVVYKLRLLNCAPDQEVVATAQVSSDWGTTIWNRADITVEDFDDKKECTYSVDTYINANCPGMEFLLILPDGVQMEIQEITYGKKE